MTDGSGVSEGAFNLEELKVLIFPEEEEEEEEEEAGDKKQPLSHV